jgi:hypothetical protein
MAIMINSKEKQGGEKPLFSFIKNFSKNEINFSKVLDIIIQGVYNEYNKRR